MTGLSRVLWGFVVAGLLAPPTAEAGKKWRTKLDCTLVENESNDGDSFHVQVAKRKYIFRLLWVDAPETDSRYPDRVAEQAAYFGITPQDAIKVGKDAAKFSASFLKDGFTVLTQFDDAMGASSKDRDYAILMVGETYLMEELVRNGLARIYGIQELPEDGPSVNLMRVRLRKAEEEAKQNRRGAWAYAGQQLSRFEQLNRAPDIPEQDVTVQRSTLVYSPDDPSRALGTLRPGMTIRVLRASSLLDVQVRIVTGDGREIEGLCRRADLGL